jgi:maleylacetoacetate isomerase
MMLKLYTYFRSSAAYRVRIALNLKGLPYEAVPVHLLRDGGQQNQADYRARSPLGTVPTLVAGEQSFTQSLAIIEYLEETRPQPALLPATAEGRARVRGLAQTIACDIHPLTNSGSGRSTSRKRSGRRFGISAARSVKRVRKSSLTATRCPAPAGFPRRA